MFGVKCNFVKDLVEKTMKKNDWEIFPLYSLIKQCCIENKFCKIPELKPRIKEKNKICA